MNESALQQKMPNTPDGQQQRLQELKRLFPDLFDGEGQLKLDDLKQLTGEAVHNKERYDFTWSGKRNAKQAAYNPTTAALTYDETRSVNPGKANGNLIIEGENLESLKCLLAAYRGAIKCIYIDPPYNTGKDFVYSDNYNEQRQAYWQQTGGVEAGIKVDTNPDSDGRYHSNWLNMIYPRLLLARQLLKDDGVIFVSIDDNEVHNLRKVMDEVFGEEKFIACFIWKSRQNKDNRSVNGASKDHEYIFCYGKSLRGALRDTSKYSNPDNDPRGVWTSANMVGLATADRRPNLHYDLINPSTLVNYGRPEMGWRYDRNTMAKLIAEDRILWPTSIDGRPRKKAFLSDLTSDFTGVSTIIGDNIFTRNGTSDVDGLFGFRIMDFPKPVKMLKQLIEQAISKDEIILDFFGGSGTTAQAVLELNKQDNGNRKFILVQLPEQTKADSEAYKAGFKKISDITIERVKRVVNGYGDNPQPLEAGFKVYRLTKSHFPRVDFKPDPEASEAENLQRLEAYITEKEAQLIGLFEPTEIRDEVLLKNGFRLDYKLQEQPQFTANAVSLVNDGEKSALICLDNSLSNKTVDQLLENPQAFICLERALNTDAKWNLRQHLKHLFIAF
ncbi:MAG: site-specific DNA-methyltransferase [Methylobacter sp.]|uniref:site-specific DNA-methyltransferase (adenine-specific) n=1 Tax=Candidatus Methylobacter titanis TaxID=3053457 RepID=A0AA43Q179_9GAMM|nr:site-specific DNA-methyltransferase [Candidatus Methylobacter titanis]